MAYLFAVTKLNQKHVFLLGGPQESAKGTGKSTGKALERDWEQTRHMATVRTVAGTARHHLITTHACASVGLRSPSTPSTVDGRNIQTLCTTWTPSTPKLNVRASCKHVSANGRNKSSPGNTNSIKLCYSYCSYCCHAPCLFPVPFQCLFSAFSCAFSRFVCARQ